jgi:hypothetical protein
MSRRRLCNECGHVLRETNNDQLHYKRGEALTKWRRGMILSAGGILPDVLQERDDF